MKSPTPIPKTPEPVNQVRVVREYVEALAIALVLAFFFKAFAAEAFVIPTGSMAATLMGRHKDVHCEQCGFPYQISASDESSDGGTRAVGMVLAGTCPQCRYSMYVGPDNADKKTFLSYSGDRIFVNKSQFDFRAPARWHVTVFRYPGAPQMNYIKRLIGVPNETVMLRNGDVFVQKNGEEGFTIQRKPLRALKSMLRPVDDNDYVQARLHEIGWPTRWFDDTLAAWRRSEDYKSYESAGDGWLKFRNIVPSSDDWYDLSRNRLPPTTATRPQLITDFLGYNSEIVRYPGGHGLSDSLIRMREVKQGDTIRKEHYVHQNVHGLGFNWVGDLTVGCRLEVREPDGVFSLQLVKGGVEFLCDIDLSDGRATISIPDVPEFEPQIAQTPIQSGKTFDVQFCNVDEEMRLIVDGREIDFGIRGRYDALCQPGTRLARDRSPTPRDLTPAAVGTRGGNQPASVKISSLKILRDMYYIAHNAQTAGSGRVDDTCDLIDSPFQAGYRLMESRVNRILSSPEDWSSFGKTLSVQFALGPDEFLMCGDNSARSKDSRLWTTDGIPSPVPRKLLIGEAVFVYWPHGLRIPGTKIALIPNFGKMRIID